jgi:aminoglycoside phosphotransferase (APT) family kinase protein
VKFGFDAPSRRTVRREVAVLRELQRRTTPRDLRNALPDIVPSDPRRGWLVESRISGPGRLDSVVTNGELVGDAALEEAGRALATLHRQRTGRRALPRSSPPWPFQLSRPLSVRYLRRASPGSLDLVRIVQSYSELHVPVESARRTWRTEGQIHGDFRWENILVESARPSRRLRFIDWELSRAGDPAWDVGAFLGECLRVWRFGSRIRTSGRLPAGGDAPTALLAAAPFWKGYSERAARAGAPADDEFLVRSVRFSAVWLVGRLFELAETLLELDEDCHQALQLGANILARPEAAASDLWRCEGVRRR